MLGNKKAIWALLYDKPDVEESTREIREVLNLISAPKMKKLVRRHNPAALVCTQAVPCSVFSAEKRRGNITIPLIAVITDFAIHSYWVYDEVDLYCAPTEDVRRDLIRRGIRADRVVVTGIPISPAFLRHTSKASARTRLKIDAQKPTLLVMGGSQGMGPLQETLDHLRELPVQCLVITGMNRDLYRSLHERFRREKRIRIFGYTRMINLFMDAADLLITKPGGLTSSEALAKHLPMIITNPIPGQEERNSDYLQKRGVAERADEPEEIANIVRDLLEHPAKLKKMQEATRQNATPYSAIEVSRHIVRPVDAAKEHF